MRGDRETARIKTIQSRCADVQILFPRRLVVVHQKNTALPIDAAIGTVDEVVCGMVRVGCPQPLQNGVTHIRFVVPVGIFEEQQVGAGRDKHAAAPELKAQRIVDVSKDLTLVGFSVICPYPQRS